MKIPNKLNVVFFAVLISGLSACGGGGGGSSPDNPPTNTSASSIAPLSSSSTAALSSLSSSSLSSAASSSAPIVTIDVTPPTVTLTGASSVQLKQGDTYSEQGATANDATDGAVTVVTSGTVDTSKVGSYTVTYTATDKAGNSANVKRTVTVTDSIAPTVTLTGASTVSVKQGAIYTELGATASDLTDGILVVVTTGAVDTSKVGSYSVTYTATDKAGNSGSATRTVTITDSMAPTVTLTGASTISVKQGAIYTELGATASDLTDGVVIVVTTGTVDTSKVGSYTITYTATDKAGNSGSATRTVTVTDSVAPTVTLTGASTVSVKQGAIYTELGATANDLTDGVLVVVTTGAVDTSKVGSYTVTYTATDKASNSANVKRTVVVTDGLAPVVTLTGSASLTLFVGDVYVEAGATALDAVDGVLTSSIVTTGQVNTATAGTYNITYSATDAAGNMGTKSRSVTVKTPDYNFSFLDKDLRLWEGEYEHTFQLVFDIAETKERSINVSIAAASAAKAGTDVDIVSGTIVISANSKTGSLKLAIHDDDVFEGTETITVKFSAGTFQKDVLIDLIDGTVDGTAHTNFSGAITAPMTVVNGDDLTIMGSNAFRNYSLLSESTTVASSFSPGISFGFGDAISYQGKTYVFDSGKLYEFNQTTRYTLLSTSPWYVEWVSELQVLNGELYITGGRTAVENATTQVLIYNFSSGVWRQGAPLNKLRYGGATAVVNGKIYVFGGNYSADTAEVFNPNTNLWTYIASNASLGAQFDTATASGKYIYVAVSELAANAKVLRYNTQSNTWATFTLIVPSREYKDSLLYKGKTFLIGGNDNTGSSTSVSSFYIGDDAVPQ